MRKDIEVTDSEKNQVGKGFQGAKSGGAVLNDLDDAVNTFTDSIGQGTLDEGKDVVLMKFECGGELPQ